VTIDVADITGRWDPATLPANVRVGPGCFLERRQSFARFRSTRDPGLVIGRDVSVYMWTAFSVDPGGLVEIGDGSVLVGPSFMCAERISVGRRVVLSHQVVIADSDFHPHDPEERRRDAEASAPGGDVSLRPRVEAAPVVIEDDAFVGSRSIVVEGARVCRGAKLGAGVVLTASTPVIDSVTGDELSRGVVPERAVAVPATRVKSFPGGDFGLSCVLVLRILEEGEMHDKLALNEILRDHGLAT